MKSTKATLSSAAGDGVDSDPGSLHTLLSLLDSNPSRTKGVNMETVHLDLFHSALLGAFELSALSPAAVRFPVFLFPMVMMRDSENRGSDGAKKREHGRR